MSEDKIIRFPGAAAKGAGAQASKPGASLPPLPPEMGKAAMEQAAKLAASMSEDQQKALGLIMSGASFVLVALKPTEDGCDFFTALHGDAADLRNAQPHLAGVIDRLYARRGL